MRNKIMKMRFSIPYRSKQLGSFQLHDPMNAQARWLSSVWRVFYMKLRSLYPWRVKEKANSVAKKKIINRAEEEFEKKHPWWFTYLLFLLNRYIAGTTSWFDVWTAKLKLEARFAIMQFERKACLMNFIFSFCLEREGTLFEFFKSKSMWCDFWLLEN